MTLTRRTTLAAALGAALMAGPALGAEKLTVGAYPTNPPWEAKNERGEFEGFEVDLVRAIGRKLGRDVEIQDLGFQALFAATSSGRIDMAISSITITPERPKNVAFTQGYYDSDMALAAANETKLKGLADLKGTTLGALATSTGETWIKENMAKYGIAGMKTYNTQQDLLLDTRNGRVDGAISDLAGMQFTFTKMPGMKIVERIPTGDQYAILMKKGSPLVETVNNAVSELKKDGTLAALHKKWLGADPESGTSTITVKPVPAAM
jgi:polar amino acid transport system substrate-binding protein